MRTILLLMCIVSLSAFADDKEVAAYLTAEFKDSKTVKSKLTESGLEYLGMAKVNNSSKHEVIFYSNMQLSKVAEKSIRGFAGALRILVNSDKKQIVIANPQYFLRAFLQKDFDSKIADNLVEKLTLIFGTLSPNKDLLEEDDLAGYHFMMAMPYYEDFLEVAEGSQSELIKKLETNAKDKIVFKKKIGDKYLYAITLSDEIENFVNKLEVQDKGVLLPYMVVVDKDQARILHAKYYLAVSLPKLSMGEFMTISNIPGEIEDAFEALFK